MVSKKRLDYGFNGFRAHIVPRAPRSIRRRGSGKKLVEDSQLCAFELLASVAGKLLQENESSASSNVADGKLNLGISGDANDNRRPEYDKVLKAESYDHGSCAESAFVPEISVEERNLLSNFKGVPQAENDSVLENKPAHASRDFLKKVDGDMKLGICVDNNADGIFTSKVGGTVCIDGSSKHEVGIGPEMHLVDDTNQKGDLSTARTWTVKDPIGECVNTNILMNSESSVQLPSYRDPISLRKHWKNVKLGIRDDDENSFGCNKFSTRVRPLRPQSCSGNRRIKKILASKYWKAAPKLEDCELYKTSDGMNTYYRYRKGIYTRESCQRVPLKKRKLSDHSFANPYDHFASSDSISNLPDKGTSGTSSTVQGHEKTKDPHVKFSIKSFRVPEVYIEVPETATVGSLKRTVMEAVTAILGGGVRVGIALQGKKVRDDGRTLQQAGISESSALDTLGFTLEPSFTHASLSKTPVKRHLVMPCDTNQQFERSPATPMIDSGISNTSTDTPVVTELDDAFDNNEFVSSSLETSSDTPMNGPAVSDSQALVLVPPVNVDALAVVPVNSKPKRSELSQRRTRRPFSVGEVEALVEAVEKLGTGRWRDVKMRAFENADHRTYVDLKDKWKTLVHTASIAPQQRRGEPVPQDLLNRVLSAHSYWTQNQPKQHLKQQSVEPSVVKMVDAWEEVEGGGASRL